MIYTFREMHNEDNNFEQTEKKMDEFVEKVKQPFERVGVILEDEPSKSSKFNDMLFSKLGANFSCQLLPVIPQGSTSFNNYAREVVSFQQEDEAYFSGKGMQPKHTLTKFL